MFVDPKSPISTLKDSCLIRKDLPKHMFRFIHQNKPIMDELKTFDLLKVEVNDLFSIDRDLKFDNFDVTEWRHREGKDCCTEPYCERREHFWDTRE